MHTSERLATVTNDTRTRTVSSMLRPQLPSRGHLSRFQKGDADAAGLPRAGQHFTPAPIPAFGTPPGQRMPPPQRPRTQLPVQPPMQSPRQGKFSVCNVVGPLEIEQAEHRHLRWIRSCRISSSSHSTDIVLGINASIRRNGSSADESR